MEITERVVKTLELFQLQHTAMTILEVHRFLVRSPDRLDEHLDSSGDMRVVPELENRTVSVLRVAEALRILVDEGRAVEHLGYFTTTGSSGLIHDRWRGYRFGIEREKRIRKYVPGLRFIPFVRGVALAGSQPLGLQREGSDIDLFVVTASGWLWLPRTLVTAYFQLCGVRRHGAHIRNRFCLNHYLAGPKRMSTRRNWYTALEYGKLRPVVGVQAVAEFQNNNAQWLTAFFPNLQVPAPAESGERSFSQRIMERVFANAAGRRLEQLLGNWERPRIRTDEKHVIVEADELSFHPNSKQDALLSSFGNA